MVVLARRRLEGTARAAADEEDVALSAFRSFCLGAREGRFPQLQDSGSLWPLLMVITANKSVDLTRRNNRLRRAAGNSGRLSHSESPGRRRHGCCLSGRSLTHGATGCVKNSETGNPEQRGASAAIRSGSPSGGKTVSSEHRGGARCPVLITNRCC